MSLKQILLTVSFLSIAVAQENVTITVPKGLTRILIKDTTKRNPTCGDNICPASQCGKWIGQSDNSCCALWTSSSGPNNCDSVKTLMSNFGFNGDGIAGSGDFCTRGGWRVSATYEFCCPLNYHGVEYDNGDRIYKVRCVSSLDPAKVDNIIELEWPGGSGSSTPSASGNSGARATRTSASGSAAAATSTTTGNGAGILNAGMALAAGAASLIGLVLGA